MQSIEDKINEYERYIKEENRKLVELTKDRNGKLTQDSQTLIKYHSNKLQSLEEFREWCKSN